MDQSKQVVPSETNGHNVVRAYFQLTRLHKFPAGNVLVFVPFCKHLTSLALITDAHGELEISVGPYNGRLQSVPPGHGYDILDYYVHYRWNGHP